MMTVHQTANAGKFAISLETRLGVIIGARVRCISSVRAVELMWSKGEREVSL